MGKYPPKTQLLDTPPLSWNTVFMPSDSQQLQETPQPISQPSPSNPPKQRNFWKMLLAFIAVIIIIPIVAATIMFFSKDKNNAKTANEKSSQNSPLNNPLIQKMAEKLPIPKITIIPITLAPTATPSQTDPQPISTQPTTPPSNNIPLESMKTYKNTSFNFSLDYPSELKIQENSYGLGVADISFVSPVNPNPQYQILIYPKTIGRLIGQDFDQFYALPAQTTQLMTSEASSPQQFTKIKNTTINGLRAFDFRTTSDPPDPNEEAEIGTYIELGENTLIISTRESNKATLYHMLSTFKSD